jgi:glutamine synthetase
MEQEYIIMSLNHSTPWPLGFPDNGYPQPQGPYYCSVGGENAFGRQFSDALLFKCLTAGLTVSGTNGEVMCGQYEIQIGPVRDLDACDQMWIMRYIMNRVAEEFNVKIDLTPKPVKGDWNGSGCHINISTNSTRNDVGCKAVNEQVANLAKSHEKCVLFYGANNYERLTGKHETSSVNTFTSGVANRGASIRIPRATHNKGQGYYEDRRPSSDIDPYQACAAFFDCGQFGGSERLDEMIKFAKVNIPHMLLTHEKADAYVKLFAEE